MPELGFLQTLQGEFGAVRAVENRGDVLPVAFAVPHSDNARFHIQIGLAQCHQLRAPQSGVDQHADHGIVAQALGAAIVPPYIEQPGHFMRLQGAPDPIGSLEITFLRLHFEERLHALVVLLVALPVGDGQGLQDLAHVTESALARGLGQIRFVDEGPHMGVCGLIDAEALLIGEFGLGTESPDIDPARCWREAVGDDRRRAMKQSGFAT